MWPAHGPARSICFAAWPIARRSPDPSSEGANTARGLEANIFNSNGLPTATPGPAADTVSRRPSDTIVAGSLSRRHNSAEGGAMNTQASVLPARHILVVDDDSQLRE